MKLYEICFSPTGGTRKVSGFLARALNGTSVNIDLSDRKKNFGDIALQEDEVAIVAVPSYSGRVHAEWAKVIFWNCMSCTVRSLVPSTEANVSITGTMASTVVMSSPSRGR